jgi:hypothetical protein
MMKRNQKMEERGMKMKVKMLRTDDFAIMSTIENTWIYSNMLDIQ